MINCDNVSSEIIDSIILINNDLIDAKLNIRISLGVVLSINNDRVTISGDSFCYNLDIGALNKSDLIIILDYLENFKIEPVYRYVDKKDEVRKKVKEKLERKRLKTTSNHHSLIPHISKIGNSIKRRIDDLKKNLSKDADLYFDIDNQQFLIIIEKYEESEFGINLLHMIGEINVKYGYSCLILSYKDFSNMKIKRIVCF